MTQVIKPINDAEYEGLCGITRHVRCTIKKAVEFPPQPFIKPNSIAERPPHYLTRCSDVGNYAVHYALTPPQHQSFRPATRPAPE